MQYSIGQIIRHRRYGYRGVVFGRDHTFQHDEAWYWSNRTQPNRDQPWYHVLVDGASHTTYVAEENLDVDSEDEPVDHPLIRRFFAGRHAGMYYANSLN